MAREVTGPDGIKWSCVQAYAGLSETPENEEQARVDDNSERVEVVCTPSGGAKTVRLELAQDWESALADEDLLAQIEAHRET